MLEIPKKMLQTLVIQRIFFGLMKFGKNAWNSEKNHLKIGVYALIRLNLEISSDISEKCLKFNPYAYCSIYLTYWFERITLIRLKSGEILFASNLIWKNFKKIALIHWCNFALHLFMSRTLLKFDWHLLKWVSAVPNAQTIQKYMFDCVTELFSKMSLQ